MALDGTGEAYRDLGQPDEAVRIHLRAAAVHRELGDDWQLALTLDHLADALVEAGRPEEAAQHRREARSRLTRFDDARASAVRARIDRGAERSPS